MKRVSVGYIYYMDLIRVIACVLVVLVHVSALGWNEVSVCSDKWQVMNAFDCLGILGVPLFFMISGALMLRTEGTHSVKKMLGKVLHLFIVYHIWLLFYNFVTLIREGYAFSIYNIRGRVILPVIIGDGIYHLWFLPVLMVLYLLTPILKKAFADRKTCEYFLALYLVFGQLIPTMLLFEFPYKYLLEDLYNRTELFMLTGYIGYFVIGHYIHSFVGIHTRKQRLLILCMVIVSYVATVTVCGLDAVRQGQPSIILNNPLAISDFIATTGIYILIKDSIALRKKQKAEKQVSAVAKHTFGIYLIHPLILILVQEIGITNYVPHPILMIPLLTAVVVATGLGVAWLLKKVPIIRRFFV